MIEIPRNDNQCIRVLALDLRDYLVNDFPRWGRVCVWWNVNSNGDCHGT